MKGHSSSAGGPRRWQTEVHPSALLRTSIGGMCLVLSLSLSLKHPCYNGGMENTPESVAIPRDILTRTIEFLEVVKHDTFYGSEAWDILEEVEKLLAQSPKQPLSAKQLWYEKFGLAQPPDSHRPT